MCFYNNVGNVALQNYDKFEMNLMNMEYPKAVANIYNNAFKHGTI